MERRLIRDLLVTLVVSGVLTAPLVDLIREAAAPCPASDLPGECIGRAMMVPLYALVAPLIAALLLWVCRVRRPVSVAVATPLAAAAVFIVYAVITPDSLSVPSSVLVVPFVLAAAAANTIAVHKLRDGWVVPTGWFTAFSFLLGGLFLHDMLFPV